MLKGVGSLHGDGLISTGHRGRWRPLNDERRRDGEDRNQHRRVRSSRGRWLLPREHGDLAGLGQPLDDLGFVVRVVDAGLPEFSRVAVLLPVVVPVPTAVRPKAEDIDLEDSSGPS